MMWSAMMGFMCGECGGGGGGGGLPWEFFANISFEEAILGQF